MVVGEENCWFQDNLKCFISELNLSEKTRKGTNIKKNVVTEKLSYYINPRTSKFGHGDYATK